MPSVSGVMPGTLNTFSMDTERAVVSHGGKGKAHAGLTYGTT